MEICLYSRFLAVYGHKFVVEWEKAMCEETFVTKKLLILTFWMVALHAPLTDQNIHVLFLATRTGKVPLIFKKHNLLVGPEGLNNGQLLTVPKPLFNLLHDTNRLINIMRATKVMKKENRQLKVPVALLVPQTLSILNLVLDPATVVRSCLFGVVYMHLYDFYQVFAEK